MSSTPKLNAYLLAADPAWVEASVLSYYGVVGRIVVSYDASGRSWTGTPIDVESCLRRIRAIDVKGKCDYQPGDFARPEGFARPMENETFQRQVAHDQACGDCDWVLQLDTDEVLPDASLLADAVANAQMLGRRAVNFPAIWLYRHVRGRWYAEWCMRGWRRSASFPGPVAVRSGSRFSMARRTTGIADEHYHVDLRARGSPTAVPNGIRPDHVVPADKAIVHLSFVRTREALERKFGAWGHARDRSWHPELEKWDRVGRNPVIECVRSQLERGPNKRHLRLTRIGAEAHALVERSGP